MTPNLLLSLKVGAAALVAGLALGGLAAHGWYSPRLELAQNQVKDLGDKLTEQNDAVERLRQETVDLAERVRRAQAAASKKRREADTSAQKVLTLARPQGVDECTSASTLIRQELGK